MDSTHRYTITGGEHSHNSILCTQGHPRASKDNLMVWGCMGWNGVGMLIEVEGKMIADQYCKILGDGVVESFEKLEMDEVSDTFSRTMTPNTHLGRPQNGLKTMISKFYHGQHSITLGPGP